MRRMEPLPDASAAVEAQLHAAALAYFSAAGADRPVTRDRLEAALKAHEAASKPRRWRLL